MGMNLPVRGPAQRVLVALLAVAGGVLLRLAMLGVVGPRTPFLTFYPAVMLAALLGGLLSGSLATLLLALLAYLWVLPQLAPFIPTEASWLALGLFLVSGALISGIAESLHRARARAFEASVLAARAEERCAVNADLQRLAAIVEASDDAIFSVAQNGAIMSWNPGCERVYGYTAEEAIGMSAALLCPPDRRNEIPDLLVRFAAGLNAARFETVRLRQDGSLVDVSVAVSAIRRDDGSLDGVAAVVRDITERRQTERALARHRLLLEAMSSIGRIGGWEFDTTTLEMQWTDETYRIHGLEPGQPVSVDQAIAFYAPEHRPAIQQAVQLALAQGQSYDVELEIITATGERRWVHCVGRRSTAIGRVYGTIQDIQQRKQVEAALRKSETRFREVVEGTDNLVTQVDADGLFLYVNPVARSIFGLEPQELLGRAAFDFVHPDDREPTRQEFQRWAAEKRAHASLENRQVSRSGEVRHLSWTIDLHYAEDGSVASIDSIAQDITERKQAEKKLRQSEERYRSIFDNVGDAIFIGDADGRFLAVNRVARQRLGYSVAELLAMGISDVDANEAPEQVRQRIDEVFENRECIFEVTHKAKDGTLIPVEINCRPITYDGQPAFISLVRDIRERKQAEAALRESQQRLLFSQEMAQLGQWDVNHATDTLFWGPGVYSILEIEPGSCAPSYAAFLALVHLDDREDVDTAFSDSLAEKAPFSVVHRLLLPSGRVKWVKQACHHEFDALGQPLRSLGIVQDITELKQAEEALRESEAFARTIIDNSPDCIKILNKSGELTYMSPSGPRLLELDNVEQLYGKPYLAFWKGSDYELAADAFHEAQAGHVGRFEGFCPTAGGTPKWWDVSIAPLSGGAAGPERFLVVSRDDTERKRTADALRIERERLAAIIDTSQDLMFLKDPELRYLMANSAHEALLGLAPRDMIGKTDFELMAEDMAKGCQESDLAALRHGAVIVDQKVGDTWYRVSKRRVDDAWGAPLGVAALITDITASRSMYEALRESEEIFRNLVESAPKAIFVQTRGCFAYVNAACLKLYGAACPEDLLGSSVLARFHPDYHALATERMRRVNQERQSAPALEMRHLRLDGRPLDVEVSAVPLLYAGENGALVFVHDITERKREEALRADMERIAKHDLKGPLNAVINLPLLYQNDPNLTPDQVEGMELIHRAGLSMLELIDQSLTLYRIETGSFELSPLPVDLLALTRQVANELESLAKTLGVELLLEVRDDLAPICGDGLLCRTMLSNLLKNAVEASPQGGEVQVRLCAADGQAEWSTHNAGTVPDSLRATFFDKYSTQGKRHGAGLGTYSARLSAEAQGGSVAMHSADGEGTTVTVRLPLWAAEAQKAGANAGV